MDNPFDSDESDTGDELDAAVEDTGAPASPFDEHDAHDELEAAPDRYETDEAVDFGDSASDDTDRLDGVDDMALWNAFEVEVADGLDAFEGDEFIGRVLGGLGRAAGVVGRGLSGAAATAQSAAGRVGELTGRVAGAAGAVQPAAQAAARLAQMLGAPRVAGALGQVGRVAQGVGRASGHIGQLSGGVGQAAAGAQGLFGQLSQLLGQGFDEVDAFDAVADMFVEDGLDEALPAAVALAARSAARGLGLANVAQLPHASRRALVRGVAAAARELVRQRGPAAIRALPPLARSAARVAARQAASPARAAQAVRRRLPATARRVAQSPRTIRRLAQPAEERRSGTGRAPLARDPQLGRGAPPARIGGARTFYIDGPVALTITPR